MEYKLVIAVREDLDLSVGKIAAQVGHAAVNCALYSKKKKKDWFKKWDKGGAKKVVVRVKDLEQVHRLKANAENLRIPTSLISDAGLTEVPPGTVTCLGVGPAPQGLVDKVTGHLSIL